MGMGMGMGVRNECHLPLRPPIHLSTRRRLPISAIEQTATDAQVAQWTAARDELRTHPADLPQTDDGDWEQMPDPDCPHCGGTGWVTVTDSVDYGSTTVQMPSDEPARCTYITDAADYAEAYGPCRAPADPDGARWMAMGWDAWSGEWVR